MTVKTFVGYGGWLLAVLLCVMVAKLRSRCESLAVKGDASLVVRAYVTAVKRKNYHQAAELCSQEWRDGFLLPTGDGRARVTYVDLLPAENELFISTNAEVAKVGYSGDRHATVEIHGGHELLYRVDVEMDESNDGWVISSFAGPPARDCNSPPNDSQPSGNGIPPLELW